VSSVQEASAALATVGETFTQRARLSDDEIRAFATSVHDHNPLHHDVAAARAAGVPVAVVAYGYAGRPAAELGADRVLDSFAALRGLVDGPQVPR